MDLVGKTLAHDRVVPPLGAEGWAKCGGRRELFRELTPIDSSGIVYGWLCVSLDGRYYLQRYRRMRSAVVLMTLHGWIRPERCDHA